MVSQYDSFGTQQSSFILSPKRCSLGSFRARFQTEDEDWQRGIAEEAAMNESASEYHDGEEVMPFGSDKDGVSDRKEPEQTYRVNPQGDCQLRTTEHILMSENVEACVAYAHSYPRSNPYEDKEDRKTQSRRTITRISTPYNTKLRPSTSSTDLDNYS